MKEENEELAAMKLASWRNGVMAAISAGEYLAAAWRASAWRAPGAARNQQSRAWRREICGENINMAPL
jgi:hypothetical protein